MFVGSETFLLANMRSGGAGTISATANINPAAIYELYQKCNTRMTRMTPIDSNRKSQIANRKWNTSRRG